MAKWKVGITGGIGSGKTYCARIFSYLGIAVYNADQRAKWIMHHDGEVRARLIGLLGPDVFDRQGNLDKDFMRKRVFGDATLRQEINAIVHPAVGKDYKRWHEQQQTAYTLKEAALLVESGSYKELDHLIMVQSPIPLRIQRIMARDHISISEIRNRMRTQLPESEKSRASNLFIDNSGCFPILPQIVAIHIKLLE